MKASKNLFPQSTLNMETKLYFVSLQPYRAQFPNLTKRQLEKTMGERAVKTVFSVLLHRPAEEIKICREGKPVIKDCPYHFNLSHSGDYLVLAVGEAPLGVDIEKITRIRSKTVEKYFSDAEKQLVKEQGLSSFFELWTKKESYVKYTGDGIKGLQQTTSFPHNVAFYTTTYEDYQIAVCSHIDHLPSGLEELKITL